MSIPDILLVVCVLILVWRVWRLEGFVATVQKAVDQMQRSAISDALRDGDMRMLSEAARDIGMGAHKRLETLASALGYEWKSTPAKSGWERKPQSDVEICRSLGEQYAKINARGWHTYMGCADRRKADRRKPVDVQKKKPKRATH